MRNSVWWSAYDQSDGVDSHVWADWECTLLSVSKACDTMVMSCGDLASRIDECWRGQGGVALAARLRNAAESISTLRDALASNITEMRVWSAQVARSAACMNELSAEEMDFEENIDDDEEPDRQLLHAMVRVDMRAIAEDLLNDAESFVGGALCGASPADHLIREQELGGPELAFAAPITQGLPVVSVSLTQGQHAESVPRRATASRKNDWSNSCEDLPSPPSAASEPRLDTDPSLASETSNTVRASCLDQELDTSYSSPPSSRDVPQRLPDEPEPQQDSVSRDGLIMPDGDATVWVEFPAGGEMSLPSLSAVDETKKVVSR